MSDAATMSRSVERRIAVQRANRVPRVIRDRIAVEPLPPEEHTSPGGIALVEKNKGRNERGLVVAVGEGRVIGESHGGHGTMPCVVPVSVSVGNTIVYETKYAEELLYGGKRYVVVREDAVVALLN